MTVKRLCDFKIYLTQFGYIIRLSVVYNVHINTILKHQTFTFTKILKKRVVLVKESSYNIQGPKYYFCLSIVQNVKNRYYFVLRQRNSQEFQSNLFKNIKLYNLVGYHVHYYSALFIRISLSSFYRASKGFLEKA